MIKTFSYANSISQLAPFVKFLVKGSASTWILTTAFLCAIYSLFWSHIGMAIGLGLGVTMYLALIVAFFFYFRRSGARIEVSNSSIALRSKLYEKEILWSEVEVVRETKSLVWRGLVQIDSKRQSMTINLPLIREQSMLLNEIRSRIPRTARMEGKWTEVGGV